LASCVDGFTAFRFASRFALSGIRAFQKYLGQGIAKHAQAKMLTFAFILDIVA
jgi:hypothetical protein